MPPLDEYAIRPEQFEAGVATLKKRQHTVMLLCLASTALFITSVIGLFLQQDLVYSFFDLSLQTKQLHLPLTLRTELAELQQPDYFMNLLSWLGWLLFKLFMAFFGAFFSIYLLKKIRFFYIRFQSFVLKFVGWLIAFILIWSGLTYVQYDLNHGEERALQQVLYYDDNIQQSEIAQYLVEHQVERPVQAYVLAQTALLHRPPDKNTAVPYVRELVQAERNNPEFVEYGFKPEQLWTLQHQVYGKALTPLAQSIETRQQQAAQVSHWVNIGILGLALVAALFSIFLYVLSRRLQGRTIRISQRLHE